MTLRRDLRRCFRDGSPVSLGRALSDETSRSLEVRVYEALACKEKVHFIAAVDCTLI